MLNSQRDHKLSIEPDDGYSEERDAPLIKSWDEWDAERDTWVRRAFPGLFENVEEIHAKRS